MIVNETRPGTIIANRVNGEKYRIISVDNDQAVAAIIAEDGDNIVEGTEIAITPNNERVFQFIKDSDEPRPNIEASVKDGVLTVNGKVVEMGDIHAGKLIMSSERAVAFIGGNDKEPYVDIVYYYVPGKDRFVEHDRLRDSVDVGEYEDYYAGKLNDKEFVVIASTFEHVYEESTEDGKPVSKTKYVRTRVMRYRAKYPNEMPMVNDVQFNIPDNGDITVQQIKELDKYLLVTIATGPSIYTAIINSQSYSEVIYSELTAQDIFFSRTALGTTKGDIVYDSNGYILAAPFKELKAARNKTVRSMIKEGFSYLVTKVDNSFTFTNKDMTDTRTLIITETDDRGTIYKVK